MKFIGLFFRVLLILVFAATVSWAASQGSGSPVKPLSVKKPVEPQVGIKIKEGLVVSTNQYGELFIQDKPKTTRNLNPECGPQPQCFPTPADDCCDYIEKCIEGGGLCGVNYEELKKINPDIIYAPYCKKCKLVGSVDEDNPEGEWISYFATCHCSAKPSPTGPFDYANHDTLTFVAKPGSGGTSSGDISTQLKGAGKANAFLIEYTDTGGTKRSIGSNGTWVTVYKKDERFWVGCKPGEMHFAPKQGESLDKFLYDGGGGNFIQVAPNTRVVLRSAEGGCQYKDYDYQNGKHVVSDIPASGFEFQRENNDIKINVMKMLVSVPVQPTPPQPPPPLPDWLSN